MTRLARKTNFHFPTLRSEGNLLPDELLQRIAAHDTRVPGVSAEAYHLLPGETLREAISRAWLRLQGVWTSFQAALSRLPTDDRATSLTRERWLLPLLQELGYGRLVTARPLIVGERTFPISHTYQHSPIHLLGWRVELDRRTEKVAGAAQAAPHSLVQDLLNRSNDHLWAVLSNGRTLRLLRDNISLVRQAFLEFDLEAMMAGEHFADFALLWLVCHQSRIEATVPKDCWLEKWFLHARDEGIRALHRLRGGVKRTIEILGSGFLHHRNEALHAVLRSGEFATQDYYRELLRLAYRLIFLFVAEDRGLLLDPAASEDARDRYTLHYATTRLRRLAERRRGGPHGDLWHGLRLVLGKLYAGCPELGLPALGSYLWSTRATPHLEHSELANEDLLAAIHALCRIEDDHGVSYPVSWQNLAAAELGSVYEALLELHPRLHIDSRSFELATAPGNERKTSGSYYTPEALVERLLDSALVPVLDAATLGKPKADAIAALLDLKICDPACGSGHFLVAAAHRMARRLATLRTGDDEAAPSARQAALRDIVGRCLFGVDINPMAVELCKVSLWMEAIEPGKPLSFLEAHVQCGNSLLGATPALLARGLPEDAFATVLEGDDRDAARTLRKRDRDDRKGARATLEIFAGQAPAAAPTSADADLLRSRAQQVDGAADGTLAAVETKASGYESLQASPENRRAEFLADLWCATLVWPKTPALVEVAPTTGEWVHLLRKPGDAKPATLQTLAELKAQYTFFHWHLRFPQIFTPTTKNTEPDDPCGWTGGFDVVIGNPPWEHVEIKEIEFFASIKPEIADAQHASERKRMILALRDDPTGAQTYRAFIAAQRAVDGQVRILRDSGRYPYCGLGRINTYAVFAELSYGLLSSTGRAGFIAPTGLGTDATTSGFIAMLVSRGNLYSLVSFENFGSSFGEVNNRQSFCIFTLSAAASPTVHLEFKVNQALPPDAGPTDFTLTSQDFELLNPNTRTCPTFRTRRDAEIVKEIYRRVPVLWNEHTEGGNAWRLTLRQGTFNMASDSNLFRTRVELERESWHIHGNFFTRENRRMVPLFEAKMVQHYDHRFASLIEGAPGERPSRKFEGWYGVHPENPNEYAIPRYWVEESEVGKVLDGQWTRGWLLGWRDICRSTDSRTLIACVVPYSACGDKFLLALSPLHPEGLLSLLSSFVVDYCTRQKLGGSSLKYFTFKQIPVLAPETFDRATPWDHSKVLSSWIRPRVLELSFTAWDLEHFARELDHEGPPFQWSEDRRFLLRAELDAAFFHLYGINRNNTIWILETFSVIRQKDLRKHGEYRTRRVILECYDAMAQALATGQPYQTILDPPPAHASLTHPPRPPDAPTWPLPPQPREVVVDDEGVPPTPAAKSAKPRRPRTRAESMVPPTSNFQLTNPPHTPQLGLAFDAASNAPPPSGPGFQLTVGVPQLGLGLAARPKLELPTPLAITTPNNPTIAPRAPLPPSEAPAPQAPAPQAEEDPPRIRAMREDGGWRARPDVLAVIRVLYYATSPRSKDQILAAAALEEKSWGSIIKLLVEANLVATHGKARGTRYTLA